MYKVIHQYAPEVVFKVLPSFAEAEAFVAQWYIYNDAAVVIVRA